MSTGYGEDIAKNIEQNKDKLDVEDCEKIEKALYPLPYTIEDLAEEENE